jgi:hypothetical protein
MEWPLAGNNGQLRPNFKTNSDEYTPPHITILSPNIY